MTTFSASSGKGRCSGFASSQGGALGRNLRACWLNSLPFNATGEVIKNDGLWKVYEFTWQIDAILFWARFEGRWLRGTEFHYPERPENLPALKPLESWPKSNPRDLR
ncbi:MULTISPECIES: hypothetical protein [unclassified Bradyrhizobium]|uniref:hypothetical protein n=1 Tax=unclassified Bradyrhizobium TaxID=2631580 RepID=UPI0033967216